MGKPVEECSLAELVEDPLIGLLMKSDGVDRSSVRLLFERVKLDRTPDFAGGRPLSAAR
jgi:hypothetical protein